MDRRLHHHFAAFAAAALALLLPGARLSAQGDPVQEIKEIAESIDEQLREIDRLLLESGKKDQTRSVPKDLLQQAQEHSRSAEDGIDKLIEKLNEMKNRGGGGGGGGESQQQQQPQDGQSQGQPRPGQGQPGARRENQTPDFVQQPQPGQQQQGQEGQQQQQPGQQQSQPQPSGQPVGGQEVPTGGENRPGNSPPEQETGPGQPGTGEGSWGELQPYLNFLRNRGATPKVPDKYRKYYEAYLKNKTGGG